MKMIGSANVLEGLYIMKQYVNSLIGSVSTKPTSTTSSHFNLWHFLLDILLNLHWYSIHQCLPSVAYNSSFSYCDVCHYAKQRKLPFSISTTKSNKIFSLVHMDIWGPYHLLSVHGHKYFLTIIDALQDILT